MAGIIPHLVVAVAAWGTACASGTTQKQIEGQDQKYQGNHRQDQTKTPLAATIPRVRVSGARQTVADFIRVR